MNEAPPDRRAVTAAWGILDAADGRRFVRDPWFEIDAQGTITAAAAGLPSPSARPELVYDLGTSVLLPGMVNAHSHSFQWAMRGRTGRRGAHDPSSFWSWREAMYTLARECFRQMLAAGITCVGEFHYVHHGLDGSSSDPPDGMSSAIIRAAEEVGIRLCLLESYYERASATEPPLPEQRRFCDESVDAYLARVDRLLAARPTEGPRRYGVGIAPHSVRAVGLPALTRLARAAHERGLPLHAHVGEQPAENDACRAEHGRSPTAVLEAAGCLERPGAFTAVHAIFVDAADVARLRGQFVCACPTTEADLGDGVVLGSSLVAGGVGLALGSDSNAVIDLVQEARLLEMHERLVRGARLCLASGERPVAHVLLDAATIGGAASLGFPELGRLAVGAPFDAVAIDRDADPLRGVADEFLLDALFLASSAANVRQVWVAGRRRI